MEIAEANEPRRSRREESANKLKRKRGKGNRKSGCREEWKKGTQKKQSERKNTQELERGNGRGG